MVAGHLQEKKGYFYMVLSYPDAAGKEKRNGCRQDCLSRAIKESGKDVDGNKADLCS